jgi:hypothetical protein
MYSWEARFWAKVNKDGPVPAHRSELGPCWLWTAGTNGRYGLFRLWTDMRAPAHRVAWFLEYGDWPSETIDHLCLVRLCVRARGHMEDVSQPLNAVRHRRPGAVETDLAVCPQGHPRRAQESCKTCAQERREAVRLGGLWRPQ